MLKGKQGFRLRLIYENDETGESRVETTRYMDEEALKDRLFFMGKLNALNIREKNTEYDKVISSLDDYKGKVEDSIKEFLNGQGESFKVDKNLEFLKGLWVVTVDNEEIGELVFEDVECIFNGKKSAVSDVLYTGFSITNLFEGNKQKVTFELGKYIIEDKGMAFEFKGKGKNEKVFVLRRKLN